MKAQGKDGSGFLIFAFQRLIVWSDKQKGLNKHLTHGAMRDLGGTVGIVH